MATPAPSQTRSAVQAWSWAKRMAVKLSTLVLLGCALGFSYDWAAPRFYGSGRLPGFGLGILHGALMPVALPSLLLGKDVPIYAKRNQGRLYKLGYIAGIDACGFFFFGLAFWRPGRVSPKAPPGSPPGQ